MVKKSFGGILIIIGGVGIFTLISNGMVFPHILGPSLVGIIGLMLLFIRPKIKTQ